MATAKPVQAVPAAGGAGKPRMEKPDQAKMERDVGLLEAEVKKLETLIDNLEAEIVAKQAATQSSRTIATEARALFNELRATQDRVKAEKEEIAKKLEAAKAAPRAARPPTAPGAERPKFKTEAEVDEAIAALEARQSSETMSLTAEKAILKQISDLRTIKSGFRAAIAAEEKAKRDRELADMSRKELQARLNEKYEELRQISARVTAQKEIMTTLGPRDDSIKVLQDRKYAAKKEVYQKHKAIKAIKDEFYKAKKAFFEFQKEENVRRDAERLAKELEWQKKREADAAAYAAAAAADAAAEAEEEDDAHPWAQELDECARLIGHLRLSLAAVSGPSTPAATASNAAAAPGKGKKKGLRDDDEFDFLSGALDARAAKPKRATVSKPKTITHSIESLSLFGKFGIDPPTDYAAFPAAITALEEKKTYYTTAPAPEKPAKAAVEDSAAAAAGDSAATPSIRRVQVSTPYGPGEVLTVRDDGVLVIKMAKFFATAYLQQNQVRLPARPRRAPGAPGAPATGTSGPKGAGAGGDKKFAGKPRRA